ncbi:UbiX family flavin prenyltransferase [uncultured Ruegeria sp.]|uniref:UbiX family flavin prenyltransferase n=1 Tax=uncultured Ruegeria sp. TaxID=259304 RepID=UPI002634032B|nr:UbiX family flavin prenyltransferase [uncultured Ruegeria sp.]
MTRTRVVLGVSGASGAALSLAVARRLASADIETDLVVSPAATLTLGQECGLDALGELRQLVTRHHATADIGASIASGSVPISGMIIAPCSMRSLAAIAHGLDDNLLTRAAGVQLKERRPLVLLAREAPLTLAHLRNMTAAAEMGAIILPPVPAFYLKPNNMTEIVEQIAARAVDCLKICDAVARQWHPRNETADS